MAEGSRRRAYRRPPTFLRAGEREELLGLVEPGRDLAIVTLFCFSGLRLNELTRLDRADVDFAGRTVHVRCGKGGKERTVGLHSRAAAALRAYLDGRRDPLPALFLSNRRRRISNRQVQHLLAGYVARCSFAGRKHVTPHCLRHSFATALMKATGRDIQIVQRALGHADIATTTIYAWLDDDEMYEAMERL